MLVINYVRTAETVMRLLVATLYALIAAASFADPQPAEWNISKAVLVTGASSGIGRKITERLAAQDYFVHAISKHAIEGDEKAMVIKALDRWMSANWRSLTRLLSQLSRLSSKPIRSAATARPRAQ